MVKKLLYQGSQIFTQRQKSILSAALIIMLMIAASRVLGLMRNRILAHFFSVEDLSVYFAAFRIPETIFEVLVFGTFSSAFIPIFTSYISQKKRNEAWTIASISLNFAFLIFLALAIFIFIFAEPLYRLIAPGFGPAQTLQIANLSRVLLLAQAFFVLSYFLTSVLESLQRFLIPALAPLLYNLGIILGTIFLSPSLGLYGPVIGAVVGAFFHFLIQLPLAFFLGFRPRFKINLHHPGVREIGRLAFPRIIELSSLQLGKMAELFLASLVSTAAYTYYTFANSLALLPIGLFGTSMAKASLPTLSYQAAQDQKKDFVETLTSLFSQVVFFILPCAVFLAVLRIPIVRLVFGADRFTWASTLQTGWTLSAFCLGILAQGLIYPLTRAFWALHDTKTPVKISLGTIVLNITLGAIFILWLKLEIWTLALAFSLASLIQAVILFGFLSRKVKELNLKKIIFSFSRIALSALGSGLLMFFLLKVLDRSAWDKNLSFLRWVGLKLPTRFLSFLLDTRYTFNLILLTAFVALIGFLSYLFFAWLFKVEELSLLKKLMAKFKKPRVSPEIITPPPVE
jgi:putative peptidoglycan lipid II flippase